jgi:hypothetical protein
VDWAYDYSDPNARSDARRGPYSLDLNRYIPLCRSCHKRFDLAHRTRDLLAWAEEIVARYGPERDLL